MTMMMKVMTKSQHLLLALFLWYVDHHHHHHHHYHHHGNACRHSSLYVCSTECSVQLVLWKTQVNSSSSSINNPLRRRHVWHCAFTPERQRHFTESCHGFAALGDARAHVWLRQ